MAQRNGFIDDGSVDELEHRVLACGRGVIGTHELDARDVVLGVRLNEGAAVSIVAVILQDTGARLIVEDDTRIARRDERIDDVLKIDMQRAPVRPHDGASAAGSLCSRDALCHSALLLLRTQNAGSIMANTNMVKMVGPILETYRTDPQSFVGKATPTGFEPVFSG